MSRAGQRIREYWAETEAFRQVFEHLRYDQQTAMAAGAAPSRARQLGLLDDMIRRRTASPDMDELHAAVSGCAELDEALVRRSIEDTARARLLPLELLEEWTQASSVAFQTWRRAREANDWTSFAEHLNTLVALNRRIADVVGYERHPMDALLSLYAEGPTKEELDDLFKAIEPDLKELQRLRPQIDKPLLDLRLPVAAQRSLAHRLTGVLGYDESRGAIATAPHPFTSTAGALDVRIALRNDLGFSDLVRSITHEVGHAIYEQNVAEPLRDTPAGRGIMPYVHESQSKFFENIVGRTHAFCELAISLAQEYSDEITPAHADALYQDQLYGPTSLIRIGTDEISFNLHILLRWRIEVALLDDTLTARDVPDAWSGLCLEYFGERPDADSMGCLQDPHWCSRYLGLFSSYFVGNLLSAQLHRAATRDGIDVEAACEQRDFHPIVGWLQEHVHRFGRLRTASELMRAATGEALGVDAYREHLRERYGHTQTVTGTPAPGPAFRDATDRQRLSALLAERRERLDRFRANSLDMLPLPISPFAADNTLEEYGDA